MNAQLLKNLVNLAIEIQQIPAPTFSEKERADFLEARFRAEELSDVQRDEIGNVIARLPGQGEAKILVVSAHLDTVFPLDTDLSLQRQTERISGPGIGDNALGVAGLLGLVWSLRAGQITLPGDMLLVGNVGEEGLGDLRGMRKIVEHTRDQALAYIALEGMSLGYIFHRGMSVQRYRISLRTAGGHSWVDHGAPSAVHELARLVGQLADLPLPERPRTILNVGVFSGGTGINVIAPWASVDVDLRSESADVVANLAGQIMELAGSYHRPGVEVGVELIGERPVGGLAQDHPLVQLAKRSLEELGIDPYLSIGSTDASLPLSVGLPAICLGLTTGGGAHTLAEHIHIPPLRQGLAQLQGVVQGVFQVL